MLDIVCALPTQCDHICIIVRMMDRQILDGAIAKEQDMSVAIAPVTVPNRTPAEATQLIKFHASLNVSNLAKSIEFYTALLGQSPVKSYVDYAKFEIDIPPLILSLKPKRACAGGPLNHLGLRVTSLEALDEIH